MRTVPTSARRKTMMRTSVQPHVLVLGMTCLLTTACFSTLVASLTGEDVAREVRERGVPATATVLEIWETGVRVNDNPVVGFLLEVHAVGLEPYEARTKALISILSIPQIQPGKELPVKYDPEDPSVVVLDITCCPGS